MHIHTLRFVRAGALLAALAVSLGMFVSSTDHVKAQADAPIDISGDWTLRVFVGEGADPLFTCTATVTQAGTDVSMAEDCLDFGLGTRSGTIDTATGDFSLSGTFGDRPEDLTGTASLDGNSMSGSYTFTDDGFSGTFDGVRQSAAAAVPATGSGPASSGDSTGPWAALAALAAAGAVMLTAGLALRRRA